MFKLWTDSHDKMMGAFIEEMKEMKKEQQQTNTLLRDDINVTKGILSQHITEYTKMVHEFTELHKEFVENTDKKFATIFKILKARAGLYTGYRWVKGVIGIIAVGALTAAGASFWNTYYATKNTKTDTVITQQEPRKQKVEQK